MQCLGSTQGAEAVEITLVIDYIQGQHLECDNFKVQIYGLWIHLRCAVHVYRIEVLKQVAEFE